jgi:hypothetical protein
MGVCSDVQPVGGLITMPAVKGSAVLPGEAAQTPRHSETAVIKLRSAYRKGLRCNMVNKK